MQTPIKNWRRLIVVLIVLTPVGLWATAPARRGGAERYLYVWAGDQARSAPDRLAVVDFDQDSSRYGQVVATRPLPAPGATGNEPHHVGLSSDGRTLALGGLLSVLKSQPEIFFFDVSRPASPRFLSSADPPQSAITDEFYPIQEGDHKVHVLTVTRQALALDPRFNLDFNVVFPSGPARPHGLAMK